MTKLFIKNMVCSRCILVVRNELQNLGFHPTQVALGEAELTESISAADKENIQLHLRQFGFELIDSKKSRLIAQIKSSIIDLVQSKQGALDTNLSDYLSQKLQHDYSSLSKLFSEVEGSTIEKYFIAQKIEKVKELLVYDELTLSEIAYRLHYSSVAHLSSQFKKVTGLSPSYFKHIKADKRKPLDEV